MRGASASPPPPTASPREVHEVVHEASLIDIIKNLNVLINCIFKSSIVNVKIKGFTRQNSISLNKTKGVHGLTRLVPQSPPTAVDLGRSATPARVFSLSPSEGERVGERGPLVPDLLNSMALKPLLYPRRPAAPACCAVVGRRRDSDAGKLPTFSSRCFSFRVRPSSI